MEWQFCINWPAIVEEAKQRRKSQKLTQQKLAMLAGVSTPTLSRFENGEKDIQLSSIMNILGMLGMLDRRNLIFPEPEAQYDAARKVILFDGKDGDKIIPCAITSEALENHFSTVIRDPLKIFITSRDRIQHEARRKYLNNQLEVDGSILINSSDL